MQLSFLYAATALAAVWASPVPVPANQAVAAQPLSKRTGVLYHQDALFGRGGGAPFTDLTTLETFDVAPTIKQIVLLAGEQINHVKLSGYFGDPSVKHDAPHGHNANRTVNPINSEDVHLNLADGEWVNFVMVQTIGGRMRESKPDLLFMRLETNLNNHVEAGFTDPNFATANFTVPAGFKQVVGFHGTERDSVVSIAPIWV